MESRDRAGYAEFVDRWYLQKCTGRWVRKRDSAWWDVEDVERAIRTGALLPAGLREAVNARAKRPQLSLADDLQRRIDEEDLKSVHLWHYEAYTDTWRRSGDNPLKAPGPYVCQSLKMGHSLPAGLKTAYALHHGAPHKIAGEIEVTPAPKPVPVRPADPIPELGPTPHTIEAKQVALERLDAFARTITKRFRVGYAALALVGTMLTAISPAFFAVSMGSLISALLVYRWRLERYEEQRLSALVESAAPAVCDCSPEILECASQLGTRPVRVGLCPICHNTKREKK